MAKQYKVSANLQQDFSEAEKKMARENIGAVDIESVYEVRDYARDLSNELQESKQDRLEAGNGISITGNIISADATEKSVWLYEELSSIVEWTGVGPGTWKPLKTFALDAGKTISVTVQGVATWTGASAGEGIAAIQLDTNDRYVSSPLRRTSLVAVQQTSGTGFCQFSATLHYTNAGANPITLYLGAYNSYGIGSASLSLRSALPSDTVGPNIQWGIE